MILGNGYDSALWLLMKGDKEDRERIEDFIRSIPEELYLEIRDKLSIINDYRLGNRIVSNKNRVYDHGNCKKDEEMYYYRINLYNYGLSLGCSVFNGILYDEELEICLYPVDKFDCITKDSSIFIGQVSPDRYSNFNELGKNIYLDSGFVLGTSFRGLKLVSSFDVLLDVRIINTNKVPFELDYNDLIKPNKLVRKKNK